VLALQEDVGHCSLAGLRGQIVLDVLAVLDGVQLDVGDRLACHARDELFGFDAEGTCGLGEDDDVVVLDCFLYKLAN